MKIHNHLYAELQRQYLEARNKNKQLEDYYLSKMYGLVKEIQTNYVLDYCKKKGVNIPYDDLQDKIEDATLFVINQYLRKPNFKIDKISAYAYFGFKKSLFKNKDREMNTVSLDYLMEQGLCQ